MNQLVAYVWKISLIIFSINFVSIAEAGPAVCRATLQKAKKAQAPLKLVHPPIEYSEMSDNALIRFYQEGDQRAFEVLAERHHDYLSSKVKKETFRIPGSSREAVFAHYYEAARLGFSQACKKFDVRKNVKISTFATLRVLGAIRDQIRDDSELSRAQMVWFKILGEVTEELKADYENGKVTQTEKEKFFSRIKGDLKKKENAYKGAIHARQLLHSVSTDEPLGDAQSESRGTNLEGNESDPIENLAREEFWAKILRALPDEELRLIATLSLREGLPHPVVAKTIGVGPTHISNLLNHTIIPILKSRLNQDELLELLSP